MDKGYGQILLLSELPYEFLLRSRWIWHGFEKNYRILYRMECSADTQFRLYSSTACLSAFPAEHGGQLLLLDPMCILVQLRVKQPVVLQLVWKCLVPLSPRFSMHIVKQAAACLHESPGFFSIHVVRGDLSFKMLCCMMFAGEILPWCVMKPLSSTDLSQ